jgi:tripartite-type tricarboxylate transporter receptor subunit TctC
MHRRKFNQLIASSAIGAALPLTAAAQASDTSVIRLLVGFAPGGTADAVARALAPHMSKLLNRTVIVDNKPGAGGRTVLTELKRSRPDGLTIALTASTPLTLAPWIYPEKTLGYDAMKDFTRVAGVSQMDFGVMTTPRFPHITDVKSLVAHLKASESNAMYGSPGTGTVPHFLGLLIGKEVGVKIEHVPYRGSGPAMADFLAGRFPMLVDTLWIERHRAGQLKTLAVTGKKRYRDLPDVPTLKELGINVQVDQYFSIIGPAGIDPAIVQQISAAARETLNIASVQNVLYGIGQEPAWVNSGDIDAMQLAHFRAWERPVKESGYVPD